MATILSPKPARRSAFTLIELLVVIAIIAILAAILFPVFAQAKESAKRTQNTNNVKQLGIAVQTYMNDFDGNMPLGGITARMVDPSVGASSWQAAIFSYVKSQEIYKNPNDSRNQKTPTQYSACTQALSRGVTTFTASSYLTNFRISNATNFNGVWGRASVSESSVTNPSSFIFLMHGQRPPFQPTDARRYASNPVGPDGLSCTLWHGDYTQEAAGSAKQIFNPGRYAGIEVPQHKNGVAFGYLDTSVRFITVGNDLRTADRSLEGRLPWCLHGEPNAEDPSCTTKWGPGQP